MLYCEVNLNCNLAVCMEIDVMAIIKENSKEKCIRKLNRS